MNTGIISTRYATALLRYTSQTGGSRRVCDQVRSVLQNPDLLRSVTLEPELERFVSLLERNGHLEDTRLILATFVKMYYDSLGMKQALVTTSVPVDGLADRIKPLLEKRFGCKVLMEQAVDPSILGGFVVEIDGLELDQSLRGRMERVVRSLSGTGK